MHWQYWPLQVPVPAATTVTAPVSVAYPVVQGHLKQLQIQVPAGHHGNTGLRVLYHQQQIYPWANVAWLTDSGALRTVEWDDEIMATGLSVQAYNTDLVPHTFYLLAEIWPSVDPVPGAAEPAAQTSARTAAARVLVSQLARNTQRVS